MRKCYVYWVHLPNSNIRTDGYVGVTVDCIRRWKEHCTKLSCAHLANAIKKYKDALIWEVVFSGSTEECYHEEEKYRPKPEVGWNIAIGGVCSNNLGRPLSDKTKKKLSEAKLGHTPWNKGKTGVYSKETLEKIGAATKLRTQGKDNPMFGKKHTQKVKDTISKANTGSLGKSGKENPAAKQVICVETGKVYDTIVSAAQAVGCSAANISVHLRGKTKSAKGFTWQYIPQLFKD